MDNNELIAKLALDAKPVKTAMHPFMLAFIWVCGAVLYIACIALVLGVRPDIAAKMHTSLFAGEMGLLSVVLISSSLSAALLAYPDIYQKKGLLRLPLVSFALFIGLMILAWKADTLPAPMPEHGYNCTIHISLLALVPAAIIFYSVGKLASTHSAQTGAAALLAAFSIGAIIARLGEETDSIQHVVQWHYLPMLAAAFIGTLIGKWLLRW